MESNKKTQENDLRTVEIHLDTNMTFMMSLDGEPNTDNLEFYVWDKTGIVYAVKEDVNNIPKGALKLLGVTIKPIEGKIRPDVIIDIRKGIPEIVSNAKKMNIEIRDYDTEGDDMTFTDEHGEQYYQVG